MRTLPSLALASLLVTAAACSSETGQSPGPDEPRVAIFRADTASTLLLTGFSGFRNRENLVVTDAATWTDVWARSQEPFHPQDPAPGIDFGEDGVIVAALGTSPSSGYSITIDSVEFFASSQKVYLTRSTTDTHSCAVLSVITNPVHMVRAPRPLHNVTFEERSIVTRCP